MSDTNENKEISKVNINGEIYYFKDAEVRRMLDILLGNKTDGGGDKCQNQNG